MFLKRYVTTISLPCQEYSRQVQILHYKKRIGIISFHYSQTGMVCMLYFFLHPLIHFLVCSTQGSFLQQLIYLYNPAHWKNYVFNIFGGSSRAFRSSNLAEAQKRVESKFMYCVSGVQAFYTNLVSDEWVQLNSIVDFWLQQCLVKACIVLTIMYGEYELHPCKYKVGEDVTLDQQLLRELGKIYPSAINTLRASTADTYNTPWNIYFRL